MSRIFISYRRSDSQDVAGRVFDRLCERFSRSVIFKDVDSIPLSVPYPAYLRSRLQDAKVVLVLIGPTWSACTGVDGERRLEDPNDWVRVEVETALQTGVAVIPLMVSGASMPHAEQLPVPLRALASRNGMMIRSDPDFRRDMDRLISHLAPFVGSSFLSSSSDLRGRQLNNALVDQLISLKHLSLRLTEPGGAAVFLDNMKSLIEFVKTYQGILRHQVPVVRIVEAINDSAAAARVVEAARSSEAVEALMYAINQFLDRADEVIREGYSAEPAAAADGGA